MWIVCLADSRRFTSNAKTYFLWIIERNQNVVCWGCESRFKVNINVWNILIWAAPCENVSSDICRQRRPWSDCAVWSGSPLSAKRIIKYYRMYEWRAKARMKLLCHVHAQNDLNLRILRMFEGKLSLHAAHILFQWYSMQRRKKKTERAKTKRTRKKKANKSWRKS